MTVLVAESHGDEEEASEYTTPRFVSSDPHGDHLRRFHYLVTSQNEAPDELLKSILGQKRRIYRPHNQPVDQRVGPVIVLIITFTEPLLLMYDNATCSPCSVLYYT